MDPNIRNLGKGLTQVQLRLSRLIELVEHQQQPVSPTLPAFLDVMDVMHAHLESAPVVVSTPWYQRPFVRAQPPASTDGLRIGYQQGLAQLAAVGIVPIDTAGAFDPERHMAIDTRHTSDPELSGSIAQLHVRGWIQRGPAGLRVIRVAQVTVYKESA